MKNFKKIRNVLGFVVVGLVVLFVGVLLLKNGSSEALTSVKSALSTTVELAETQAVDNSMFGKALGAGLVVGLAALGGTIAMGLAVAKSTESISRQPESESKIRTTLMLGLVFIETLVIYGLIVAILIIFVL